MIFLFTLQHSFAFARKRRNGLEGFLISGKPFAVYKCDLLFRRIFGGIRRREKALPDPAAAFV